MEGHHKEIIEEEIRQLNELNDLIDVEKEAVIGMDRENLLDTVRKKEKVLLRLNQLNSEKQNREGEEGWRPNRPEETELYNIRARLLKDVRKKNITQQEILETQMEQVECLMAFFKHFQAQSAIYDSRGRLR